MQTISSAQQSTILSMSFDSFDKIPKARYLRVSKNPKNRITEIWNACRGSGKSVDFILHNTRYKHLIVVVDAKRSDLGELGKTMIPSEMKETPAGSSERIGRLEEGLDALKSDISDILVSDILLIFM